MMNQLGRVFAVICVASLTLLGLPTAVAAPAVRVGIETSADSAPAGETITVTADVDGARANDVVAVGVRTANGWTELDREPVTDETEHTFEVTPPALGRNVFRVAILRGARLLAASDPAIVTGQIAVDPDPVADGRPVSLRGTLPTAVTRPVVLQARIGDDWSTVDAGASADDGAVEFSWTPAESGRVRFVAPARSIAGVVYPRFVSPAASVTVQEPQTTPTLTRLVDAPAWNPRLSGDGQHLLYTSEPAVSAPALYSSNYLRDDDPVRTRPVPSVESPASSAFLGISANGRYVLTEEQIGSVNGEAGTWTLFIWDTTSDHLEKLIALPRGNTSPANAKISADGSTVAFSAVGDALLPGDDNGVADAYLIDRDGSHLRRISNGPDGRALPNGAGVAGISADGSVLVLGTSDALDGDRHPGVDYYRWDTHSGAVQLITRPDESADLSEYGGVVLSEDGRSVSYSVITGMLVGRSYVWDADDETRVEVPTPEGHPSARRVVEVGDLSADGRFALLDDYRLEGLGLYRWDRVTGAVLAVSGTEFGDRPASPSAGGISDDGSRIVFTSGPDDGEFREHAVFLWSVGD